MKHYFLSIVLVFALLQGFTQEAETVKYGSNLENGKLVTVNNNQIYFESYGEGTPLLLLHGGLGSILNFQNSIESLAKHFKVIAIDSPGHGRSSHVESLSYDFMAGNISAFIDELELDSAYVMGWSDGGIVGLLLAADAQSKVKKLIGIGVNTRLDALSKENIEWMKNGMFDWAKDEKGWWYTNHSPLIANTAFIDAYLENTKLMWLTDIYVEMDKIQSIQIPTMIMQGDKDAISLEHTLELHHAIKKSQLCILPNTPHYVFGENVDLVNQIAINFFKGKL